MCFLGLHSYDFSVEPYAVEGLYDKVTEIGFDTLRCRNCGKKKVRISMLTGWHAIEPNRTKITFNEVQTIPRRF